MAQSALSADRSANSIQTTADEEQALGARSVLVAIQLDALGYITEANSAAVQILGLNLKELMRTHYSRFLQLAHVSIDATPLRVDDPVSIIFDED